MKAVRIHEHGDSNVLKWENIPDPKVGKGQVGVEIRAAAMNHLDLWVRNGLPNVPLPLIPGSDGAGVVRAVGLEVAEFKPGDEVLIQPLTYCGKCTWCKGGKENYCSSMGILGETEDGTDCEYLVLDSGNIRMKPEILTFEEAAAIPLVAQTAYSMLVRRAQIQAGETVLVWGAGSGVGSMAIQIARSLGCRVIATGGSEEKLKHARDLGADAVVNHYSGDVVRMVRRETEGRGADVILEHVGASTWENSLRSLAKGGRLVTCGATTGPKVEIDLRHLYIKQQSILGSTMGDAEALDEVLDLVREGKIRGIVDRVFPMSQIQAAHTYLEDSNHFGKVVLVP